MNLVDENLKLNQNKILEKVGVSDLRDLNLIPIEWVEPAVGMADELSLSRSDS